jgi:methionyl-tRNA formyltransferase
MRISLLCSDENHPVNSYLKQWISDNKATHTIELVRNKHELSDGEILFLISCSEIINASDRSAYLACLVLHASDLPKGRGWSPHIWQILEGAEEITLSLLEAEDKVDSGRIWQKMQIPIPRHALWDEINASLFEAEIALIDHAVRNFDRITPEIQDPNIEPDYYPRRKPSHSKIDPTHSIASQFNQLRVCDPYRFPAFFELEGCRYKITLEKLND